MIAPTLRARLRAFVAARTPFDDRERRSIAAFLDHFDALADPCSETADPVHVTGSGFVVGGRGIVLHKHKRLGIWLQPGGHIEPGELPWEAALREAQEETGLAVRHPADGVRFVHVDVHPGPRGHTHLDLRYLLVAGDADPSPPAGESPEAHWFTWAQAIAIADEGLRGALAATAPTCTFALRAARAADAGAVADVFLRSRRMALAGVVNAHSDEDVHEWVAAHLVPETELWVGVDGNGRVVGMMALVPGDLASGDEPLGWIEHLYLDPSVIGMGLGTQLVERAKQRFAGGLQLWTFQVNSAAQRFYVRHGFDPVEHTDGRGNEEGEPDVRMAWRPDRRDRPPSVDAGQASDVRQTGAGPASGLGGDDCGQHPPGAQRAGVDRQHHRP
jgi:8-oxo-dGTP pyrophosphatase MutT (NUDIX family)/GNAT superfamily N-acetyltransferase